MLKSYSTIVKSVVHVSYTLYLMHNNNKQYMKFDYI